MIILIDDSNKSEFREELDKIHVLRHEVFVEELKWSGLRSENGREYDQYDGPGAVYIAAKEGDEIAAAVRLNWFDKPTLLSEVFPGLVQFEKMPGGSKFVDLSRFVVSPKFGDRDRMTKHGCELICGILEYGVSEGITNYTAVISTHFLSTVLQWGVEAHAMGFPVGKGRDEHLAVRVPATATSISHLYHMTRNYEPRLRTPDFVRCFRNTANLFREAELSRRQKPVAAE
jgi:acyl-homoserine lactone synthase